jgi:murein DD-endopeptidase MepM/ murein hydrolase activator NlpD
LGQILRILPIDALYYQVQSGDTLSGIAKKYNLDQDEIIEVNKLDTSDNLFEGQGLFLPGAEKYPKQAESKDTSSTSSPSSISTPASAPTKTQNTGGVTWTEGALNELDKIYLPSARPVVKAKVEAYALEHGISVITKEIYLGIHV